MADVSNELIFEVVKQMQGDLSQVKDDVRDIKVRLTANEEALAGINRRLDRVDDRLERLERRANLIDG